MDPLFIRMTEGYAFGELGKTELPAMSVPNSETLQASGYVRTQSGEWVHDSEAVLLPQGGQLVWVKL